MNASEIGNSPSVETGSPSAVSFVGSLGLMENSETVSEPVLTAARTLPFLDALMLPCENRASGPSDLPWDPRPPASTALSRFYAVR